MRQVLEEDGAGVIGHECETELIERAVERQQPDVVVLDPNHEDVSALGERIQLAAPQITVILWARDETVMDVLEPVSRAPRRVALTASEPLQRAEQQSSPRPSGGLTCPRT
jgi:AmiR/NasT family two-component response regulator